MAISNENGGMVMPVGPMYGSGFGGGFGGGGDWWGILLLIALLNGGFGFGGFGGGMMPFMMGGMADGAMLYPWLNNSEHISDGFRDQMIQTSVSSIGDKVTSGFGDMATQLCGGFAGVTAAVNGAQNGISQQLYSNEIASLNRSFAEQTANTAGFSGLQSQLAQCCCDNRLATCQTQNIIGTESAATRSAIQAGIQTVLDKMCQDKIDEKNEKIVELQNRLNMADFAASQASQNNYLQNALTAQTQYFLSLYPPTAGSTTPATT